MKKILTTLLTTFLLSTSTVHVLAEESTSLSEDLTTVENNITFGTVLVATLTPALFIIICYLLIKFFKENK